MVPINYWAVLVAAVFNMVLGSLWYGPLFGKKWTSLMAFTPESMAAAKAKGMTTSYVIMMVGSLIMAFVLAHAVIFANTYMNTSGVAAGLIVGFMNWLGFVAPVTLGTVLWDGKPWKLWVINAGYYFVGLIVMGAILAVWK